MISALLLALALSFGAGTFSAWLFDRPRYRKGA